MKKEFSILIQFIFVAGLVAGFFFSLVSLRNPGSGFDEFIWLRYWICSFIILSAIRFGVYYVIFRQAFVDTNQSLLKVFLSELSKTFQYFLIAVFSEFGVCWAVLYSLPDNGFSYDLTSLWYGIHHVSLIWLFYFSVFSLVRLGIICFVNSFRKTI